jgi:hypothetical protein
LRGSRQPSVGGGDASRREAIRDTLFDDLPLDRWPPKHADASAYPGSSFAQARELLATSDKQAAKQCWFEIVHRPQLESRHHLQAWAFLRAEGEQAPDDYAKRVLGVVVDDRTVLDERVDRGRRDDAIHAVRKVGVERHERVRLELGESDVLRFVGARQVELLGDLPCHPPEHGIAEQADLQAIDVIETHACFVFGHLTPPHGLVDRRQGL